MAEKTDVFTGRQFFVLAGLEYLSLTYQFSFVLA